VERVVAAVVLVAAVAVGWVVAQWEVAVLVQAAAETAHA
jgi:hypothetical protein